MPYHGVAGGISGALAVGIRAAKAVGGVVTAAAQQLPFGGISAPLALLITAGKWIGGAVASVGAGLLIGRWHRKL